MIIRAVHKILSAILALVWLVNGLWCKILNMVPRHEAIVARILSNEYAPLLIRCMGIGEVFIGLWIITRKWPRACVMFQLLLIGMMNVLEFYLAPDLLLFGKMNAFFALLLMAAICYNEFIRTKSPALQAPA